MITAKTKKASSESNPSESSSNKTQNNFSPEVKATLA